MLALDRDKCTRNCRDSARNRVMLGKEVNKVGCCVISHREEKAKGVGR